MKMQLSFKKHSNELISNRQCTYTQFRAVFHGNVKTSVQFGTFSTNLSFSQHVIYTFSALNIELLLFLWLQCGYLAFGLICRSAVPGI